MMTYTTRLALLFSTLLVLRPGTSQEPAQQEGALLLVASRSLGDENLAGTVVLLVQHDLQAGSAGLVLNKGAGITLGEALPDFSEDTSRHLYAGGPAQQDNLIFLFQDRQRDPTISDHGGQHVTGHTFVGTDPRLLQDLLVGSPNNSDLRVFSGQATWAPGQLVKEISRGDWHTHFAKEDTIWGAGDDVPLHQLWTHLQDNVIDTHKVQGLSFKSKDHEWEL